MINYVKENSRGTVFIVDDDEFFRRSISRLLKLASFEVYDFASAGDFLVKFSSHSSGCILLDIRMPGPDGLELFEHLQREGGGVPVVFLTGHAQVPVVVDTIKRGAFDFLTKPVEKDQLIKVVEAAIQKGELSRQKQGHAAELRARFKMLTQTEKKILHMVVAGLPNKAIADRIGNAERTVKLHRSNLSQKLGAQCVADLVRFYYEGDFGMDVSAGEVS
ncbi:response regulator [Coraliomargarita sp. SDUM461004]|uniref:Response regulator n=1 Tax=Thalassobacterium sedimentorum TaxID=3041258 RepID=A0ABU1AGG8_9BACT|nr:response regulator [Coraliomargarita sp. SDUM461004]MDQ8193925.1 response regulator [Coraliomargarita sp. SDUM461004]